MEQIITFVILAIIILLIVRLFGAWMMRINEVIREQKKTNEALTKYLPSVLDELKQLNSKLEKEEDCDTLK